MPAYYSGLVGDFVSMKPEAILGILELENAKQNFLTQYSDATLSWDEEIPQLQASLRSVASSHPAASGWGVLLEFPIPRRQKRADVIIIAEDVLFVLEFKRGIANAAAYQQVWDYALDLVDFHLPSHNLIICSATVASSTEAFNPGQGWRDRVQRPRFSTPTQLGPNLIAWFRDFHSPLRQPISFDGWNHGQYRPVPTIVEAALAVFAGMEVREIAHSHTEAKNLLATVDRVVSEIQKAFLNKQKVICFVTGVPGAGKTLAGLRAVHSPAIRELTGSDPHFMSGNGPLVKILREALIRDRISRSGGTRAEIEHTVETLIQNVHVMAREQWEDKLKRPPQDRIIVFDEAQRAWNAQRNLRKFKRNISEPEMILEIMDRHPDWAVVVALVGGGQEIHDGEAGLAEWGLALNKFPSWHVVSSEEALNGGPAVAGTSLFENLDRGRSNVRVTGDFHLPISTRSYKAEALSAWVNAVVDNDITSAATIAADSNAELALVSRDLDLVKRRMTQLAQGTARYGLVASSSATRLRADGIETSTSFHRSYPHEYWFLNGPGDVRSSYQLEVAATEFEIQGLELDLVCLCWGGDFVFHSDKWVARKLASVAWRPERAPFQRWSIERNPEKAQFLKNSYRVLLTRARQQLFIWVPVGDTSDGTRSPEEFDSVYSTLLQAGAKALS
jgi:hypothetical protein